MWTCSDLELYCFQNVSVCDLNAAEGHSAVKQLCEEFGEDRATFIKTDVTNATDYEGNIYC